MIVSQTIPFIELLLKDCFSSLQVDEGVYHHRQHQILLAVVLYLTTGPVHSQIERLLVRVAVLFYELKAVLHVLYHLVTLLAAQGSEGELEGQRFRGHGEAPAFLLHVGHDGVHRNGLVSETDDTDVLFVEDFEA